MSTDSDTFADALAAVDVESVRITRADLEAAIEEVAVGETVGVADETWPDPLPPSVTWDPTPAELWAATTGVTPAGFAIAEYGSLVLPTRTPAAELVSLYAERHVAVLEATEILPTMEAALDRLDAEIPDAYGDAIIATGPSATADMGALVKGAHGPTDVRVIVLED
jgi:L-lactate dehydrogenase complex protein LldG